MIYEGVTLKILLYSVPARVSKIVAGSFMMYQNSVSALSGTCYLSVDLHIAQSTLYTEKAYKLKFVGFWSCPLAVVGK